MSEDRITEKVYCYDHPSAYNNHDALAIAAMAGRRDNDCWPMMAMMNGGGWNQNQWMNNPFAYMMMMAWMRNWNNNCGDGGNGCYNNQLAAIQNQMQDNQNSTLLMDAVKGNDFAISQLSQNLGLDFKTLEKSICDVRAAIQEVAGRVDFSAERVINAANLGDCRIIEALKDCCCGTKELIQRMGYENQLAQKDLQFSTQKGISDLGFAVQSGFDRTNSGIERGFSATAFQAQQDKCDIIRAGEANTQRIIDTLNTHWKDEQAREIQDLKAQISQLKQTDAIIARLQNGGNGCGCGCGNGCGL